jgi:hypothetical protein
MFAYPFARITMSNYHYIIQAAEKQLLIKIDRQVARQLGHVGYLHVPRWGRSTLHRARIFQGRGLKSKVCILHVAELVQGLEGQEEARDQLRGGTLQPWRVRGLLEPLPPPWRFSHAGQGGIFRTCPLYLPILGFAPHLGHVMNINVLYKRYQTE